MIRREHRTFESEARWRAGRLFLRRSQASGGVFEQIGRHVQQRTLQLKNPAPLGAKWMRLGRMLAQRYDFVRFSQVACERVVNGRKQMISSVYLEVRSSEDAWSHVVALDDQAFAAISRWCAELNEYLCLPLFPRTFSPELIVFSPASFGHVVHELIGHRSESDDHAKPLQWRRWLKTGFDIWETPGRAEWLGHTPFDDRGRKGLAVKLLNGASGEHRLLNEATGNARASAYDRHALIRQRCLEIRANAMSSLPSGRALFIDDIRYGEFDGEAMTLVSSQQRARAANGRMYRLPSLRVRAGVELLPTMQMSSTPEVCHPAGGCRKDGQSVPVTFVAPQAWCLAGAPLKIESDV